MITLEELGQISQWVGNTFGAKIDGDIRNG